MKGKNGVKFFLILLILGIVTLLTSNGMPALDIPSVNETRLGIDIRGGVYTQLYPEVEPGTTVTENNLASAQAIIEKRLDGKGIFDRNITTEVDKGRIIVEIPWKPGEQEFNPYTTVDEIGRTALLTFQEVNEELIDEKGDYLPTGTIIIGGTDVINAIPEPDTQRGGMMVRLELTQEAQVKFSEATGRLINKPIAIFMDENLISAPIVSTKIDVDSSPVITLGKNDMNDARAEAKDLADSIRAGALPFRLVANDIKTISPTLGEGALKVAINAGVLSFILVALFMILYYRLPGIVSAIALFALVILQLFFITAMRITLTLPGIAGIILTIGMGVDANIIIFERIKEEIKAGKTLRAAIDVGFKRAFSAILDANVTTLISAVVLYWLGTGAVKGFAVTLGLGVILSFITAITASRIMLNFISDLGFTKKLWLYGVKEAKNG